MTLLTVLFLLAAPPPHVAGGIGILRMDPLGGVSPDVAGALTQILARELAKITSPVMVGKNLLRGLSRRLARCEGQNKCLRKIGQKKGLKWMVVGTVSSFASNYLINVKLMDVTTGKANRVSVTISGNPDVLIDEMTILAYRMLAPGNLAGTLRIVTNLSGAEVYIDGQKVGKTPLKPLTLKEGEYELRIASPGYVEFRKKIQVRFRKATLVEVQMDKLPKPKPVKRVVITKKPVKRAVPFYEKPWFVGTVAAVAGVVAFSVGYVVGQDTVTYDVEWVK